MEIHNKSESPEALANRPYIRFDSGVEHIPPNEEEDIKAVAEQINAIQKAHWNMHRHCYSGTHARTQGLVKGKLVVPDDLPKRLKQSMFAHGGEYPVLCRYSSEPGDPGLDASTPQVMHGLLLTAVGPHPAAPRIRHEGLQCARRDVRCWQRLSHS